MDVLQWIEEALDAKTCNSEDFIYEDMDSQSGRSLPIVYQEFDSRRKGHWQDRGSLFDFLFSVRGENNKLLDFGPGDGWPSLIVAPFAAEIIGIEGSEKRVAVCSENATRLGVANVEYVFARPGTPLPFGDDTFDGIMASSSVEQTPDPQATLAELFRVLRPAGRLRINYESLSGYRNGHERDAFLWGMGADRCRLILYDRDIEHECVRQYGLTYAVSQKNLVKLLDASERSLTFDSLTIQRLEALSYRLLDARVCRTTHPSGQTLATWPLDIGFSEVYPTHSGSTSAGMLFDSIPKKRHPSDLQGVDELVRPLAEVVCALASPLDTDPMLTAVK